LVFIGELSIGVSNAAKHPTIHTNEGRKERREEREKRGGKRSGGEGRGRRGRGEERGKKMPIVLRLRNFGPAVAQRIE
jgi:hypothetical protein